MDILLRMLLEVFLYRFYEFLILAAALNQIVGTNPIQQVVDSLFLLCKPVVCVVDHQTPEHQLKLCLVLVFLYLHKQ